jgi:polyphosphate glucokinase
MAKKSTKPRRILAIDIGGNHVKMLVTGAKERRVFDSGPALTPRRMVREVKRVCEGWEFDAVSIGYPGPVKEGRPAADPANLGAGWKRFDFAKAFGKPVRVVNDAAMQALGSYDGGRMLFLGLGTGLGSAMVVDGVLVPLELAHMPYRKGRTFEEHVGVVAMKRFGRKKWSRVVAEVCEVLSAALLPDYVVIGGGNVRRLKRLPPGVRAGDNANAFQGGFALWDSAE